MTDFAFETELSVRFRDLDPMGHVNNAVYVSYLEQARTHYIEDVLQRPTTELDIVVVNLEIDYIRSVEFKETVSVAMRTTDIGTSSITMEYEVRVEDEVAAIASSVIVVLDDSGSPRQISDDIREKITEFEDL